MRILLVEDDPQLQAITPRMIRRIFPAAKVEVVDSTADAMVAIVREEPALIVSDFDLGPGPDGGVLLCWLRIQLPHLLDRFVFLSGNATALEMHHRAIAKPFTLSELRAALV